MSVPKNSEEYLRHLKDIAMNGPFDANAPLVDVAERYRQLVEASHEDDDVSSGSLSDQSKSEWQS